MKLSSQLKESPSQTAGPYVHIGCTPNTSGIETVFPLDLGAEMLNENTIGERIEIVGQVFDGAGMPLRDALIEIWQADANGLYPGHGDPRGTADPNFPGWGRQATDRESGNYEFRTIRPGRVPAPCGRLMTPHVTFWIVARGINMGLQTRMYFPEEANSEDPILSSIEHQLRVPTLIAERIDEARYCFDIRLQGEGETIFFDI